MGMGIESGSTSLRDYQINYDKGQYTINGKAASEAEVNKALPPHLKVQGGDLFDRVSGAALRSTHLDENGPLPDVNGKEAPPGEVNDKLRGVSGEMGAGALMWAAMSELARVSMREMKDAKDIKQAMHKGKIEAKTAQINSTEKQIAAERSAATEKLVTSCCAAVVAFAASGIGSALGAGSVVGAGLTASATALSTVTNNAGDLISKTSGGQKDADEAKLQIKRNEMMEAVFDDNIDSAKSNYDEAKEQFKLALRILDEHSERQTQVIQKITS